MKNKIGCILPVLIIVILIFGRRAEQTVRPSRSFYLSLKEDTFSSGKYKIEMFRGKMDTLVLENSAVYNIKMGGGGGGASYFLGCKYSEFDPLTLKRVFLVENNDTIRSYRFDELDSLPYVMIDTFKVHILQ